MEFIRVAGIVLQKLWFRKMRDIVSSRGRGFGVLTDALPYPIFKVYLPEEPYQLPPAFPPQSHSKGAIHFPGKSISTVWMGARPVLENLDTARQSRGPVKHPRIPARRAGIWRAVRRRLLAGRPESAVFEQDGIPARPRPGRFETRGSRLLRAMAAVCILPGK